jgi:putative transcriptional regulator
MRNTPLAYSTRMQARSASKRHRCPDVRAIRERLGLSQSQLASVLNVSKRTLENWEQGRRGPTGAAQTLLRVMQHEPSAVRRALRA